MVDLQLEFRAYVDPPQGWREWSDILQKPVTERPWRTDEEAAEITGLSVRSMRTLQTSGVIKAHQATKPNGGFVRVWHIFDVLIAFIAAELVEQLSLSLPQAGELLGVLAELTKLRLIAREIVEEEPTLYAMKGDWFLEFVNATYIFIDVPKRVAREAFITENSVFPLAVIDEGRIIQVLYTAREDGTLEEKFRSVIGPDKLEDADRDLIFIHGDIVRMARQARENARSVLRINLSLAVRAGRRRAQGLSVSYIGQVPNG